VTVRDAIPVFSDAMKPSDKFRESLPLCFRAALHEEVKPEPINAIFEGFRLHLSELGLREVRLKIIKYPIFKRSQIEDA
jgi:hypothetical protein